MVKCDEDILIFQYFNDNNQHELISKLSYDTAAEIISDLMLCPEFQCDSTISHALYIAMRKLQGFSDEDIQKLTE